LGQAIAADSAFSTVGASPGVCSAGRFLPCSPLTAPAGMKRFHGNLFLAPTRLYFVCTKQGGAWAAAIGQGVGGLIGGAIAAMATGGPGAGQVAIDEAQLQQAVAANEGSLIMEPAQIEIIKETIWWRLIRWNGKKFGLPMGLGKPLKKELALWTQANNVQQKGLG